MKRGRYFAVECQQYTAVGCAKASDAEQKNGINPFAVLMFLGIIAKIVRKIAKRTRQR